jgi:hypothetical protein
MTQELYQPLPAMIHTKVKALKEANTSNTGTSQACWRELPRPETHPGATVVGAGRNSGRGKTKRGGWKSARTG